MSNSQQIKNLNGKYIIIKGFSLTNTEYAAAVFGNTSFYDFGYHYKDKDGKITVRYQNQTVNSTGNSGLTLNTYYLMNNIILKMKVTGSGTQSDPYIVPMIRIPLTADYWLKGSNQDNPSVFIDESPYFLPGQTNVCFTAMEYRQYIIDLIYYCNSQWNEKYPSYINLLSFTLDLHWNYCSEAPLTSGSYKATSSANLKRNSFKKSYSLSGSYDEQQIENYSKLSSKQLPMCGVAVDDVTDLGLTDNTLDFWESVATIFGVNLIGEPISTLPSAYTYTNGSPSSYFEKSDTTTDFSVDLLNNIFFELYNEPHIDEFTDAGGKKINPYSNKYSLYVNSITELDTAPYYRDKQYYTTGFFDIYDIIRNTVGAVNNVIFASAENFAYINFYLDTDTTYGQWDKNNGDILNTYNSFTTLRDAIITSKSSNNLYNVIFNLHPYCGLYSGATKHAGYYDSYYYKNPYVPSSEINSSTDQPKSGYTSPDIAIAGFGQICSALQEQDYFGKNTTSAFYLGYPLICTEFGNYDLPWGNYKTFPTSQIQTDDESLKYAYSDNYFNVSYTSAIVNQNGAIYGEPYYAGRYVDSSGKIYAIPGIIGYLTDFEKHNISFCLWAIRPNSGGDGTIYSSPPIVTNNSFLLTYYYSLGITKTNRNTNKSSSGLASAVSWSFADSNPDYYTWNQDVNAWAAFQPDIICGSGNSYTNYTYNNPVGASESFSVTEKPNYPEEGMPTETSGTPLPNGVLYFDFISSTNQDLSSINDGANGADFKFIFDNYYLKQSSVNNTRRKKPHIKVNIHP